MFAKIRGILAAPVFEDEDRSRKAKLLCTLSWILFVAATLRVVVCIISGHQMPARILLIGLLGPIGALCLASLRRVTLASLWLLCVTLAATNGLLYTGDGSHDTVLWVLPATFVVAVLLLPRPMFIIYTFFAITSALFLAYAELMGWLVNRFSSFVQPADLLSMAILLLMMAGGAYGLSHTMTMDFVRMRAAQQALTKSNEKLFRELETHRRIEAALHLSEERYRHLFELESDAIFLIDNATGQILEANTAASLLYGYTREELLCKTNRDLSDEAEETQRVTCETPVTAEHVVFIPFRRHRKKDGTAFPVEITGRFFTWQERPVHIAAIRDITERIRVEEALHESRMLYQDLVETAQDLIWQCDAEGCYTYLNPAWEGVLGYRPDEMLGKCFSDFQPPEYASRDRAKFSWAMAGHNVQGYETRFLGKDGREIILVFNIKTWQDERGNVRGTRGTAYDVTARKKIEDALRGSESRYRALFSNMAEGVCVHEMVYDADGKAVDYRILDVNPQYEILTGITQSMAMGRLATDLYGVSPPPYFDIYANVAASGRPTRFETYYPPMDKHFLISVFSPAPGSFATVFSDIGDRKRAEMALQDSNARLCAFNRAALALAQALNLDQVFDAISGELETLGLSCMLFPLDEAQTRLHMRYISYDPVLVAQIEELTGLTHGDYWVPVSAVDILRDIVWGHKATFIETAATALRQILPESHKQFADDISALVANVRSIGVPLLASEKVIAVLFVQSPKLTEADMLSITAFAHQVAASWHKVQLLQDLEHSLEELTHIQEQLLQSQKMEAVGRLAAGIAHDFRNLLTTIGLYAQMPLRKEKNLSEEAVRSLEIILGEAHRAGDLVQQILDFSRRALLKPQPLDLQAFLVEFLNVLRRTIPEDIRITLAAGTGEYLVEADPTRLQQALLNLAVNAQDAMPGGGELCFTLYELLTTPDNPSPVAEMPPGRWVCLAVTDTGTGMTEAVRAHLFEPFFTTKPPGLGTGLGLAQVYGTIRQHEGYIAVSTAFGHGTTFTLYLPLHVLAIEPVADGAGPLALIRGKGETLLLVEDDKMLRSAGQSILESLGYHVFVAENGREALSLYEAKKPIDLVITDFVMPEMGGKVLIRELRDITPDLRVLGITGYAAEEAAEDIQRMGFADVVHKPFDVERLAQVVRRVLDTPR
ncbi:MAG: PAS domain S-box protein [Anaerolineae bacterium]|nr:PAS domain S-box protein [Anaerolineae bacterium]